MYHVLNMALMHDFCPLFVTDLFRKHLLDREGKPALVFSGMMVSKWLQASCEAPLVLNQMRIRLTSRDPGQRGVNLMHHSRANELRNRAAPVKEKSNGD